MKVEIEQPSIRTYFAGRSVLITGSTGFMGKVLTEKLLRSCPDIAEIFLLIRPLKGIGVDDRLKKMLENKLFDKLRTEQPSSFDKLVPIVGDAATVDLGLLPADRQKLIDKVSVIFHNVARVKFNSDLKDAVFVNIRSTRDICILASSMKQLTVLQYVSSTYTQIDKHVIDEILYPTDIDWRRMIEIAESVDEHILRILTAKYIGAMPNTYIFTKKLSEQVISDYSETLPCVIIRPSIVLATLEEPIKGWVDNFNGPLGIYIMGGKGILRVVYTDPTNTNDYVPVDVTIKTMIISAWLRGLKTIPEDKTVHVYNCSSHGLQQYNSLEIQKICFKILREEVPLERVIWCPHAINITNFWVYYILLLLLHILPAICIDRIIKFAGRRPMLLKLQRKLYVANYALRHFMFNEWCFKNTKCLDLIRNLSAENMKDFGSSQFVNRNIDIYEYYKNGIISGKLLLLNEDMNNLKAAKLHYKRMEWLHNIVKTIFITYILWIVYYNYVLPIIINVFV